MDKIQITQITASANKLYALGADGAVYVLDEVIDSWKIVPELKMKPKVVNINMDFSDPEKGGIVTTE